MFIGPSACWDLNLQPLDRESPPITTVFDTNVHLQVYRHRESQLYTRAIELEETIKEQNETIRSLSPRAGAKVNTQWDWKMISNIRTLADII